MDLKSKFPGILIILSFIITISTTLKAQENKGSLIMSIESGMAISGNNSVPFYILSDKYGLINNNQFNGWASFGVSGNNPVGKNSTLGFKINITDRYAGSNELFFNQSYAEFNTRYFKLRGGLWEEFNGNNDSTLSSGSLLWSGNARPVPMVSMSTPGYLAVPFTGGHAHFKAGISHGWVGDNRFVTNLLLHHKYLYLKTTWNFPVNIEYGLQHFAQWGGTASDSAFGKLPSDINAYIKIFLAKGGTSGAPEEELVNAIGNHLGSHNFRVFYRGPVDIDLYLQTIFEDKSGQQMKNFPDGLWGLKFSSSKWKIVRSLLFEYLHTVNQSGTRHGHYEDDVFVIDGGDDNYFNHFIYGGWIYKDMTIGNPFILSPEFSGTFTGEPIINNKIKALHIGVNLVSEGTNNRILYSYSVNKGTNRVPISPANRRHSFLIETVIPDLLPGDMILTSQFAADFGDLNGNNFGFFIKIAKHFDALSR